MEDPIGAGNSNNSITASANQRRLRNLRMLSDSTPRNTRTGIDDGATVTEEDDMEQDALINDGVVTLDDEITQVNNRAINDDGNL